MRHLKINFKVLCRSNTVTVAHLKRESMLLNNEETMERQTLNPHPTALHLNALNVGNHDLNNLIAEKHIAVNENNYLSKSTRKILNYKEMKKFSMTKVMMKIRL